jgi:hypothetical protein
MSDKMQIIGSQPQQLQKIQHLSAHTRRLWLDCLPFQKWWRFALR